MTHATPATQPFASWSPTRGIWETTQLDLYGLSAPFSAIWPTCGWMHDGSAYRLPLSALLTTGSASSSSSTARFRTPLATDSSRGGETLDQVRARRGTIALSWRVALVGSEIDDPEFTKLIETCGAMVVVDRYCFGSFPSREEIEIHEGESAFEAICRHYLHWNQCARFMDGEKIDQRHEELKRLVDEFKADGVIYQNMKFCEFWSYEKVLASHVLTNEMGVPTCTIEKEYSIGSVGQLRTRFQAFIESLEIKKINS